MIKLLAQAVVEQLGVYRRVGVSNTRSLYEIKYCRGRIASAAQSRKGGHTRVIPSVDNAALNEKPQKTLAHNRVGDIHSAEFALLRFVLKFAVFDYPVVEWAVIAEF